MSRAKLARGALVLSLAGFISKAIGALYRIPLFRMIGAEGMGLYQMAYPLYTLLLTVSSAGIPVAVSKLVAERNVYRDYRGARKILLVGLVMMGIAGVLGSGLLYAGAPFLAENVLKDSRAFYSIIAISPAIFFVALMSVFRGYFQGFQKMVPTAVSQVVEQTARVVVVLVGAYIFLPRGIEFAAAAATSGAVAGALAGFAVLAIGFAWRTQQTPARWRRGTSGKSLSPWQIGGKILSLSLPISIGGLVLPMVQILDAVTVPLRLQQAGYSTSSAAELYGQLTGGANTLINLPTIFTLALATSLVPIISEMKERNRINAIYRYVDVAVKAALTICLPAAAGLYLLAEPVAGLLFDCPEAGVPLAVLAPAAIFLGLHQATSGVLQGLGKTYLPVKNLVAGALIKFSLNYQLTGLPDFGIKGAAIGTVAGFLVSSLLNCFDLYRVTKWRFTWQVLSKPLVAATIMAIGVYFLFLFLKISYNEKIAALACIFAGALLYISMLALIDRGENSIIRFLLKCLERHN